MNGVLPIKSFGSRVFTLIAAVLLGLAPGTRAATLIVTNTADNLSGDPDAPGSLREAIAEANPGDTIVFANSLSGQTIYLISGQLNVGTSLTIDASALPGGIMIGAGDSLSGVFDITSGSVIFKSLTVFNAGNEAAGAIYITGGALTLNDCTVCTNTEGSGIDNNATLVCNDCTISGNSTPYVSGGIYNNGSAILNNCTLSGNLGSEGGGLYNNGTLAMTNCILSGNSSGDVGGGGLYNHGGTATLDDCVLASNTTSGPGGGILIISGTVIVNNCTLSGNTENSGTGGGGGLSVSESTAILNNCTLSGNAALGGQGEGGGGGIELADSGTLALTNCTISANTATNGGYGGGINNESDGTTFHLSNTIVAGNTASGSNDIGSAAYFGQNCLVGGNPQLAPLGNYGGPTPTMPPLPGSPAIDAGVDIVTNFLATDQRGFPRLAGLHVDIGAAEGVYNAAGAGTIKGISLANGSFHFNFTNYEDMSFTVFATTNMALPFNLWSNLGVALETPAGSGQFQFTDTNAATSSLRFYHVASP